MVQTYTASCMCILLNRWPGVMSWMKFLLLYGAKTSLDDVGFSIVTVCTKALATILTEAENDPLKLEIVSMTCTVDIVLLLLCQVNPKTKRYYDIPPTSSSICAIVELARIFLNSQEGWDAMHLRLRTVDSRTRQAAIRFFIVRIEQMVSQADGTNFIAVVKSYLCLVEAVVPILIDDGIWQAFHKEGFIVKYTSALCLLTEKAHASDFADPAFWTHISAASNVLVKAFIIKLSPNPGAYLPKMIEGGILKCLYLCLPHVNRGDIPLPSGSIWQALVFLQPFMYLSQAYVAAALRRDLVMWSGRAKRTDGDAEAICSAIDTALNWDYLVYVTRQKVKVSMCSNLKHPVERGGHEVDEYYHSLKTCTGCHAVTYCSQDCQKEDWESLHSKECSVLAMEYRVQKYNKSWSSIRTKRDQVRMLEANMNLSVGPLPEGRRKVWEKFLQWRTHSAEASTPSTGTSSAATRRQPPKFRHAGSSEARRELWEKHLQWKALRYPHPPSISPPSTATRRQPPKFRPGSFLTVFDYLNIGYRTINRTYSLDRYCNENTTIFEGGSPWMPRIRECISLMEENRDEILLVEGRFRFDAERTMFTTLVMRYNPDGQEQHKYSVVSSFTRTG
ncbi:hypothetical protein DFP72DRAFT_348428 [Ephemerocybe angulata]|uniref:MYND-type domain-containing protein n=1 Tax=Ephemerocybe angulata TaxID=980116 RepID=A0A8H6I0K2_9AGAR|nr:hypothetical protein DFP72DRAFT_348428 [Tulosesus angulatus]